VADASNARTVEVSPGARVTGIDIELVRRPVFHVTVRASAASGLVIGNVYLELAQGIEGLGLSFSASGKNPDGDLEFRGVPPGA
jgi:hypothetical protein